MGVRRPPFSVGKNSIRTSANPAMRHCWRTVNRLTGHSGQPCMVWSLPQRPGARQLLTEHSVLIEIGERVAAKDIPGWVSLIPTLRVGMQLDYLEGPVTSDFANSVIHRRCSGVSGTEQPRA